MKGFRLKQTVCCIGIMLCASGLAHANVLQQRSRELKTITHKIHSLKSHIVIYQSKKKHVSAQLKSTEGALSSIRQKIRLTHKQINEQTRLLNLNKQKQLQNYTALNEQKAQLEQLIRYSYRINRQSKFKMVLNGENPNNITRYLRYAQMIDVQRMQLIEKIHLSLRNIHATSKIIEQHQQQLTAVQIQEREQRTTLEKVKSHKTWLLHHINHSIQKTDTQLKQLNRNKQHLERVIRQITERAKTGYAPGKNFNETKGKLLWPCRGKVLRRFGQLIAQGHLRSTGVLIAGSQGAAVSVVFQGRVLFANFLRGFGLLVIVQHGNHFLTLYAHNQKLFVKPGMNVRAGEKIATLGTDEEISSPALYFEIRHKNSPLNPLLWLRKTQ
ncbi:MAG: peptidoglycan DD-metalloendopeptidase family protein [Pseudomonadota bacterium]|nr:peptidoglycan DD-metalloendopeptidase family protein [Gammaproteobacteria bacterium]MBU1558646.1 peptidoglycan DD-metalloendopeptidase family protein [Gammaproteobacteria bacterium]MBU1629076.1 peptidoglycan DD-metalloendopeptidase family protein [Gammaproteobacteria bacterium]MBU1926840.1 peptidoglycan DD-metalloendopeptidase family protein [Gammaproteobacteria bacterium]MBU2546163.1 peptidoglycan DD-metalloendopeptidase family protein [Gammaproteobacteria bacterium]